MHINFNSEFDFLQPYLPSDAIRLGSDGDGGYVVSQKSVMESEILLSFGLGDNFSFEKDFKELNLRAPIWIYDHTVPAIGSKFLLKSLASSIFAFQPSFFKSKVKFFIEYKTFNSKGSGNKHERSRVTHRSYKPIDKSLVEILAECESSKRIFLKIDIEGDEYKIIEDLFLVCHKICGLVIEFHNAGTHSSKFKELIISLNEFLILDHLHVNNYDGVTATGFPEVVELSFSNKDLGIVREISRSLPLRELDFPNTKKYEDYSIEWSTSD